MLYKNNIHPTSTSGIKQSSSSALTSIQSASKLTEINHQGQLSKRTEELLKVMSTGVAAMPLLAVLLAIQCEGVETCEV
eukprot:15816-Heterococcus_DN1.PRE.1